MRNIFDQYDQPENKLTHALYCTLDQDRTLLRPFLKWLGIKNVPPTSQLLIVQQHIPGSQLSEEKGQGSGLPDLCIYTEEGWAVIFEMKIQSKLKVNQLKRHVSTAKRYGFESPSLVVLTVEPSEKLPAGTIARQWRELYSWFDRRKAISIWPHTLVNYMEAFESKAIADEYKIRGTITMFNGIRFSDESPYTYREAKRLIRLLGDELQKRKDLQEILSIDPKGQRRPAITNDPNGVWDFLPLSKAHGAAFTKYPHFTIVLRHTFAVAAVTVPNGVSGRFKTKLKEVGSEGFFQIIEEIEQRLRSVSKKSQAGRPFLYALQRHYRSQSSKPTEDGRVELDLRTCVPSNDSDVKHQPEWAEAIYHVLVNKRSNIQCGIEMRLDYLNKSMQSKKAVSLFAESWKAMKPLVDFVLA